MSLPQKGIIHPAGPPKDINELFGQMRLKGFNAAGSPVKLLAENDGTLRQQLILYDGTTQRRAKSETDGSLISVEYGKQSGGTLGAFRLNSNNQQQIEIIDGSRVQVDPVLIPNAEGVLWNPGSTAAEIYEVMFKIVNSTSSSVSGVNIGQDIGGDGGPLTAAEYWEQGLIIPGNGNSGWLGPHIIPGDDDVRGVAGTNNVLAIHWNIKRVYAP